MFSFMENIFSVSVVVSFNSFMKEVLIVQKPVQWLTKQTNGLVPIRWGPTSWQSLKQRTLHNLINSFLANILF